MRVYSAVPATPEHRKLSINISASFRRSPNKISQNVKECQELQDARGAAYTCRGVSGEQYIEIWNPGMAYQLIIHMVSRVIVRGGAVVVSCESAAGTL